MVKLTYKAKSGEEFQELVRFLKSQGFGGESAGVTAPAPVEKGDSAIVALYKEKSGQTRLRLTEEERAAGLSKEDVARARLAAMGEDVGVTVEAPPAELAPFDGDSESLF